MYQVPTSLFFLYHPKLTQPDGLGMTSPSMKYFSIIYNEGRLLRQRVMLMLVTSCSASSADETMATNPATPELRCKGLWFTKSERNSPRSLSLCFFKTADVSEREAQKGYQSVD
jgi:hypothetical protein